MADIQPYDVVTYDSVANKLIVSDLRLPCVYESAEPNPRAPQKITVLGHEFTVLESALESIQSFDVGKTVVLLLTADGNVAGMAEPGAKTRSTAIGLAEGSSVKVFLPAGGTIELKSSSSLSDSVKDQLVTVSSSKAGVMSASRMSDRSVGGVFDLQKMTLGSYPVTAGVHVFERVSGSTVVQLELADIQAHSIPGDKIATYHLNSSDMVDFIILEGATGDAYQYGLFFSDTREVEGDESGKVSYVRTLRFESPEGTTSFSNVGYIGDNGVPGGIAVDGDGKLRSRVTLEAVEGVSRSDFFVSNGASYVNAGGKVYQVSNKVACYNTTTKVWFTGDDPLYQIRAYSDDLTIYVDPYGEKVRVITTQ